MNILFVEDDPGFRMMLQNLLLLEGWLVEAAENGRDALERMSRRQYDLIISDIYMPVMDGIKFHRAVRAQSKYARLPFLFISAYDDEHTMSAVQDPFIEGFLKKGRPVSVIKEWINYLLTPEDDRPKAQPGR
jgi:CheY-like chemotaxis protein